MKPKRSLKYLILGLIITRLSFALDINQSFEQALKDQNFRVEKNEGNVIILKNEIFILKLSPIGDLDEIRNGIIEVGTENLKTAERDVIQYKNYYYYSKIIPLDSIESNISVEMLYPKSDTLKADKWRNRDAEIIIKSYLESLYINGSLESEYSSLLKEYKDNLDVYSVIEKSLNGLDTVSKLPSTIKSFKNKYFSNEISFDALEKRNEFWIDSETQKYADGKVTLRDEEGNLIIEQTFSKGLPNGKFKSYYRGGKKLENEGKYVKGEKEGTWIEYYENSNKKTIQKYKNGKREGKIKTYFENKEIRTEGEFENGKREGKWTFYYENGEKKAEGRYEKDEKIKKWKYYNTNGELKEEIKHTFTLF